MSAGLAVLPVDRGQDEPVGLELTGELDLDRIRIVYYGIRDIPGSVPPPVFRRGRQAEQRLTALPRGYGSCSAEQLP